MALVADTALNHHSLSSIVCCGGEITGVEIMWHWSMVGVWDGPGLSDKSGWQSDCG